KSLRKLSGHAGRIPQNRRLVTIAQNNVSLRKIGRLRNGARQRHHIQYTHIIFIILTPLSNLTPPLKTLFTLTLQFTPSFTSPFKTPFKTPFTHSFRPSLKTLFTRPFTPPLKIPFTRPFRRPFKTTFTPVFKTAPFKIAFPPRLCKTFSSITRKRSSVVEGI